MPVDQTDYIEGIEYLNGSIQAIYHAEGRAVPDGSSWRHEYVITDHLGNTRFTFADILTLKWIGRAHSTSSTAYTDRCGLGASQTASRHV